MTYGGDNGMAAFEEWVEMVLAHEGGYVFDPNDRGGMTNMGITQKSFSDFIGRDANEDDMRDMTRDQAIDFYRDLWEKMNLDRYPPALHLQYADMQVNTGRRGSDMILQMSINTRANPNEPERWIDVDGIAGRGTLAALENADVTPFEYFSESLMFHANNAFVGSKYGFKLSDYMANKEANPDDQNAWGRTRTAQNGYIRGWHRRDLETYLKAIGDD